MNKQTKVDFKLLPSLINKDIKINMKSIYFMHIPKCGGTTIDNILNSFESSEKYSGLNCINWETNTSDMIERIINTSSCLQNPFTIEPLPSEDITPFLICENISNIFSDERILRGIIEQQRVITHNWISVNSDIWFPHKIVNGSIA